MLGIPASTIRAWEDRYGLVKPARSAGSQRIYSRTEIERLRFVKEQIESGISAADAHRLLTDEVRQGHVPHSGIASSASLRPLILIAEKDPYAADLEEYFLRTEGWDVAVAFDDMQAKLIHDERSPEVVIIDLLISGGAGFRLLREFAAKQSVHVIAVSAMDSTQEALKLGAAAFLRKPLEPLALVSTVRDLIGQSALVQRHVEARA